MDDEADVVAAEDAVKLVFPLGGETGVAAFAKAVEFAAIVPAAGFLAEVAANRPLVAKLGLATSAAPLARPA